MRTGRWIGALPLWLRTFFLRDRAERELQEELQFHLQAKTDELVERGADPAEARRMALRALEIDRQTEQCREARAGHWLDMLGADLVFGARQLKKHRVATATAVLSLGLAVGGCISAFRLVDALFLHPMPVDHPERLYGVFRDGKGFSDGKPRVETSYEYPIFQQMRETVREQAQVVGVSYVSRTDVSFGGEQAMEKAEVQYVSDTLFGVFGLRPAAGRLLTAGDDVTPGAHPYADLSYEYWTTRFGRDPRVIGTILSMGNQRYQVVGIAPKSFTGTERGKPVDIFLPVMMNEGVKHADWGWIRILVVLKPGASAELVQEQLRTVFETMQRERLRDFSGRPQQFLERFLSWRVSLRPAPAGISTIQSDYHLPLLALSGLLGMLLCIACGNQANQMSAQAAARSGEMALRFSLGAGRGRLIRMVLAEGALMSLLASTLGWAFSWWATPFLLSRIQSVDLPIRLSLEPDWRVLFFGVSLTVFVTLLFALLPALRASAVNPLGALKGDAQPRRRRQWMLALIGAQTAFCFVVLFLAGLLVTTSKRLTRLSPGFVPSGVLLVDVVSRSPLKPAAWDATMASLRSVPGVTDVAQAQWPLLSGATQNCFIALHGEVNPELNAVLHVSADWRRTMKIPLLQGRDLRMNELGGDVPVVSALVNETFASRYFGLQDPVGKRFTNQCTKGTAEIVGVLGNARYEDVREGARPLFYLPIHETNAAGGLASGGTLVVRTAMGEQSATVAETLRKRLHEINPEIRIENLRTQQELMDGQTVRERLLAMMAAFFAVVAALLAGIGLYGVLSYSVLQREREFGIRIAIGAPARSIARLVTAEVLAVVSVGTLAGAALALLSVRFIRTLLFAVNVHDPLMFVAPAAVLLGAAALAAVPPVLRAVSIDPVRMLRSE